MIKKIFFILATWIFLFSTNVLAQNSLPFTDIGENSPYFSAVKNLYDARVISDDGSHLFHPESPMNRDFFVSLAVQIGCKKCLTPTLDDLIKYQNSPFVDLPKTNEFYYCIAHAENEKIAQGYIPDASGKVSCENGQQYQSNPFCADNSITRIEAAAMLLRRANLWNDSLNSGNFDRSENISDADNYWYGYAKKALEIGILTKNSDNSVKPNKKITRGEFAKMASVILEYSQCNTTSDDNSEASFIEIHDKNNTPTDRTIFEEREKFTFVPRMEGGNHKHSWTAHDGNGRTITSDDTIFDGSKLPPGKWFIEDKITDPSSGKIVSRPSVTITVMPKNPSEITKNNPSDNDTDGDGVKNSDDKCPTIPGSISNEGCPFAKEKIGVSITGNPIVTHIDNPITFTPKITGTTENNLHYRWDFGNGNSSNNSGTQTHSYGKSGTYTITLTVTNPKTGETGQSTMIIRITDNKDTDGDGIFDHEDKCPLVRGTRANQGCPDVTAPDYGCTIRGVYNGNADCNNQTLDRDGDGVNDSEDQCPDIPGSKNNHGCPENPGGDDDNDGTKNSSDRCPKIPGPAENFGCPRDTDGDKVPDISDKCPAVRGLPEWQGCPHPDLYNNISQNVCLLEKLNNQGLITGVPACNSCPCVNNITITSHIRDCDVLFPSILSPDKNTIYSR